MVRPQEVTAPKEKIEILKILEDGTQTKKGYSVALVKVIKKNSFCAAEESSLCERIVNIQH
ncbi:hypothetical protein [Enterococcus hirae]|uniref:hypothetical protein n=1 Tax=Enterococcus hirae TaxID=1354 RepID=UPI002953A4AC|nr:hypothetical protein [Enterococcus hirae]MDV7815668.1 hypothetical protein [Enterococcus hirae]